MKVLNFIKQNFNIITIILLILVIFRTCNSDSRILSKKIDKLTISIDSLKNESVSKKELQIEGLKTEKRMIQSTDRKMLDVSRQAEIDKEISALK